MRMHALRFWPVSPDSVTRSSAVRAPPSRGERMRQAIKRRRVALDDPDDGRQDLEDPIEEAEGQLAPPGTPASAARRGLPPALVAPHSAGQGARQAGAAAAVNTRFVWDDADVALLLSGMEKYGRAHPARALPLLARVITWFRIGQPRACTFMQALASATYRMSDAHLSQCRFLCFHVTLLAICRELGCYPECVFQTAKLECHPDAEQAQRQVASAVQNSTRQEPCTQGLA